MCWRFRRKSLAVQRYYNFQKNIYTTRDGVFTLALSLSAEKTRVTSAVDGVPFTPMWVFRRQIMTEDHDRNVLPMPWVLMFLESCQATTYSATA